MSENKDSKQGIRKRNGSGFIDSFSDTFINARHLRGFVSIIAIIVLIFLSILMWIYFIALEEENGSKMVIMEAVIYGGILIISMIFVFFAGYDDNAGKFIKTISAAGIILSVIGSYVLRIQILSPQVKPQGEYVFYIIQFFIYVIVGALMCVIPVLIIFLLRMLVIKLFDIILG